MWYTVLIYIEYDWRVVDVIKLIGEGYQHWENAAGEGQQDALVYGKKVIFSNKL